MPDATGLERPPTSSAIATQSRSLHQLPSRRAGGVPPAHVVDLLTGLRKKGYTFLASLHGVDYYPEEPRLGVIYELLDMQEVDRISVNARLHTDDPRIATATGLFPGAEFPEREVYDMFGVVFAILICVASSCPRTSRASRSGGTSRSAASPCCSRTTKRTPMGSGSDVARHR